MEVAAAVASAAATMPAKMRKEIFFRWFSSGRDRELVRFTLRIQADRERARARIASHLPHITRHIVMETWVTVNGQVCVCVWYNHARQKITF